MKRIAIAAALVLSAAAFNTAHADSHGSPDGSSSADPDRSAPSRGEGDSHGARHAEGFFDRFRHEDGEHGRHHRHHWDDVARVMTEFGLSSWLVGIDGELRAAGLKHDGRPWAVGHERPSRDSRALMGVIELRDCAVATSGNYRHVVEVGGRCVSHTMDPRRGAPLDNDLASVTVLAPTAMAADAWATALMVLGGEPGIALARKLDLKVVFVTNDGDVVASEGFQLGG